VQKPATTLPQACDELTAVLGRALLALGRAGRPIEANRLAAQGYVAVRLTHRDAARRLNGVMHAVARMERPSNPTMKETTMADTTLDVRNEPPARRHELIFARFDGLTPGDGFELVNDHDPKPLYYQLDAEHTGEFTWDYREEGPEVWRVRIGRAAA
jgi:uncharacterized protein (DUF2249 family)